MASPGLNSAEITLAPSGHIWVATTVAAAPTNVTTAMATVDPLWQDLGYATDNGVTINPSLNVKDIFAWQVATPVKVVTTTVGLDVKFELMQWTVEGLNLFLFGSTGVSAAGTFTQTVSSNPSTVYRSMTIEWTNDFNYINRFYIPNCIVTDHQQIVLKRSDAVMLGLTIRALDSNGTLSKLISNDPHLTSDS